MNITIREVNPKIWREIKVEAVKGGLTMGEAVNLALEKWLNEYKKKRGGKKLGSFWDIKPMRFKGEDSKELSMKVDEVLYGWKK